MVKISLPEISANTNQIAACADDRAISTLRDPIYFPASTPWRGARLMYRGEKAKAEDSSCLYLALDTLCYADAQAAIDASAAVDRPRRDEPPPTPGSASDEESPPGRVGPPVVLRWKIAPGDGWRAWDAEQDTKASDLKRPIPIEKLLQGQFVDPDKRFTVPISGGLNWTFRGYLSCAIF